MAVMAATGNDYDAVIIGLGETGYACAAHLAGHGARVAVTDTRARPPAADRLTHDFPGVPQFNGGLDGALLRAASMLVLSPGIDPRLAPIAEARASGVEVIGEIELFARSASAPVVAITGSNGKSTVTSLVGSMMRAAGWQAAVGGNLGPPALTLLSDPEPACYVLELSSFQLETVSFLDAAAAVVLNISPDHMDRYDSVEEYAAAKARIYRGTGVMVINGDDPTVAAMADVDRRVARFSLNAPDGSADAGLVIADGESWLTLGETPVLSVASLPLAGDHNIANALAALVLGHAIGLPMTAMAAGLAGFQGLPHRMEALGRYAELDWFNDSKATNVGAAVAALSGHQQPFVLIAGGQGKDQSFDALRDIARRARGIVVMGESANAIREVVADVATVVDATDMTSAVAAARQLARDGDAVVLSPACASFDQYDGYAARGEAFRAAVEACGDD
jgi:UDP-N-acetylmuramoylalanine--D-glutamate ligase